MVQQVDFPLRPYPRGYHLITEEVEAQLPRLPKVGLLHLFIQHTSAGLCLNENADPSVRVDFETIMNRIVPEGLPDYTHIFEGDDDMPAHVKAVLTGSSVSIPIQDGRLHLGTWQGIYLCEFRNQGGRRRLVGTIIG